MTKNEKETLETILFLEKSIHEHSLPEDLKLFGKNKSHKIRVLACQLSIVFYGNCDDIVSFDDPSHLVRTLVIKNCKNLTILKRFIKDTNSSVRLSVLQAIDKMAFTEDEQDDIFSSILCLINDRDVNVRLSLCKVLAKFKLINFSKILKMFDKEDIGTFIYAAEDESIEVKKQIVCSMAKLVNLETANCAFDFLCDFLNDDSIDVRLACIKLISKICSKYLICKDLDNLFGLILCSKEQNDIIRKYFLKIISSLSYFNISPFFLKIFSLFNKQVVLNVLKKIVKNNKELFKDEISKKVYFFSNEEQRKDQDIYYLCDLVILKELARCYNCDTKEIIKFDIKDAIDFDILKTVSLPKELLEICNVFKKTQKKESSELTDTIYLVNEKLKELELKQTFALYLRCLLTDILDNRISIDILPYKLKIKAKKLIKIMFSDNPKTDILFQLRKLIKYLIKHPESCEIIDYSVSLVSHRSENVQLTTEFLFKVEYPIENQQKVFLVLEKNGQILSFQALKTLQITLYCQPAGITFYLKIKNKIKDEYIVVTAKEKIN